MFFFKKGSKIIWETKISEDKNMENLMHDLKSEQKALLNQITLLSLALIIATIGCLWMEKFAIDTIFTKGFKGFQLSAKLSTDLSRVHANVFRIQSMTASGQNKQDIANLSEEQLATMNSDVALVKSTLGTSLTSEEKKYYQAIMDNLVEYQKMSSRIIKLASVGTGAVYVAAADERFQALNQTLSELTKYESNAAEEEYSSFNRNYYIIVVVLLLLCAGAIFRISSLIKKYINNILLPVKETADILREVAEGKYPKNIEWESDDEIGELVQAVNAVRVKIGTSAAASQAPKVAVPEERRKSLSGMVRKPSEHTNEADQLVTSTKDAIDKLRDIS
jgi:HAMP domain-containing protein